MNKQRWVSGALFLAFGLGLLLTENARALIINRTSDSVIYIDTSSSVYCSYASYQIINTDGATYSNLWVKVDSFTGTVVKLGGGDPGLYNIGTLPNNTTNTVFVYLATTNTTAVAQSHTVKVYRGYPTTGVLLTNQSFSVTVSTSGQNSSQTITSVSVSPNPPTVGGVFTITATGNTGTIGGANKVNFTPAVYTNWDAAAYQLVGTVINASGGNSGTFSNTLVVTFGSQVATAYTNVYYFRAVAVTGTNSISPLSIQSGGGGNFTHAPPPSAGVIPPIQPATNMTSVANLASATQLYTNEVLTYTVRFANASTNAVSMDTVQDTLPAGFTLVPNSSTFGGASVLDPAVSGQILTWSERYAIPGGSNRDLTFQATPSVSGYATNAVVAFSQSTEIDTTWITTDSFPASVQVRVLLAPTAGNDVGATLEDSLLTTAAPGVLGNDTEPNGFSLTVLSYTQPAHGSVSVNADGSYSYSPATNYNGSDSFTYTLTNGNARAAIGTVNLTVTAVNDAPTLNSLGNLVLNENDGQQTVPLTAISAGPANENSQSLTITAVSSNPGLIPNPTINYVSPAATGSLLFTPTATSNGVATIWVVVQDSAATANGGVDSVTNSFQVTVNEVNQAPSFVKGADQTVPEDAGPQAITGWATALSAGPPNESSQTLAFHVSNDNPSLFLTQPSISAGGTLTYATATNANGSATVSVYLSDNGGTDNGGADISATQTFSISVTPVNDPPTLSALQNVSVNEDAGEQIVSLSGISPGPANESGQALTVTATSSNPALIPNPTVDYSSAGSTGSLQFTPAAHTNGVAQIMVVVTDDGGSASGGVDAVTNWFTVNVGAVVTTWNGDSTLTNTISDATGAPGVGYSQYNFTGSLDILATSNSPITLDLLSLSGALPGLAANFDYSSNYTWSIITTTRGISGFDPTVFQIDTAQFANDLAGGTFSLSLSADSNSVNLVFAPNHAPVAGALSLGRPWGSSFQIAVADLLNAAGSDPDGDATTLVSMTSTNGTAVSISGGFVSLSFINNLNETFSYTVQDSRTYRPGDTVQTSTGALLLTVTNALDYGTNSWVAGLDLTNTISDATGAPGVGYSQINLTGSLEIQATSNSPITLELLSLTSGLPGLAANFNYSSNYTWSIITTTLGVTGFDPAAFLIDTTQFANDLAGGTFSLALSADSNAVNLVFTPNHAPTASTLSLGRPWGTSFQIAVADLLSAAGSDPDGDATTLVSVTSTNGTAVSISGGIVSLSFINNLNETFSYTVQDSRTYRPGDTVQTSTGALLLTVTNALDYATNYWVAGLNLTNTISDAAGAPGVGYSQINLTGSLEIQATSNSPITLELVSLSSGLPGLATNFNYSSNYTWTIITSTLGIRGFDPAAFLIDTTQFANDLGGGMFSLVLSADSNSVALNFTPNHAPVANALSFGRPWGGTFQIGVSNLLAQGSTDPDGDATTLVSVTSTNGTIISINSGILLLSFASNATDTLSFTVQDARTYRPGDTVQTSTSSITLAITNAPAAATSIVHQDSGYLVTFLGMPGYSYDVERTTNLVHPQWVLLYTTNTPANGTWEVADPAPPYPAAFYRARQH